jgi:hypothetical protein
MVVILFFVKLTLLDFMVMFGADNVFLGIADLASFPKLNKHSEDGPRTKRAFHDRLQSTITVIESRDLPIDQMLVGDRASRKYHQPVTSEGAGGVHQVVDESVIYRLIGFS